MTPHTPTVTRDDAAAGELQRLALAKMSAVLGPERARQLMRTISGELGIELRTPQELLRFSEALARYGGFESAVGAMLGVSAVIRGASPTGERAG